MYTSKPSPSENLGWMAQQSKNSTAFICTHSLFFLSLLTATMYLCTGSKIPYQIHEKSNNQAWVDVFQEESCGSLLLRISGVMLAYITGLVHSLVASTVMFYSLSKLAFHGKIFSYKSGFFKDYFLEPIQLPYSCIC